MRKETKEGWLWLYTIFSVPFIVMFVFWLRGYFHISQH